MNTLNKKFIWAILLGVISILTISFVGDYKATMEALAQFQIKYLPLILGLTFLNYLLRFVKWHYLLGVINVSLEIRQSFSVFLSGLAMAITPGKVGELLKSFLLKELKGVPVSRSAPILMAERISDGIGMALLALAGIWYFQYGKQVVITVVLLLAVFVVLMQFPEVIRRFIIVITRVKFLNRFETVMHNLLDSAHQLFKPIPLLFIVVISVVSWSFECIAFYFVFRGLAYDISILVPTFTLAFSSIVGGVSMLPGGLGAAESSLLGLLVLTGVPRSIAAVSTILIRFSTLWFGVLVGMVALLTNKQVLGFTKKFKAEVVENESDMQDN